MGDGGKVFVAFAANLAAAYAVFKVACFKPKLCGDLQTKLKGALRLFAEGSVRLRRTLDAGHGDQSTDVPHKGFAVLPDERIYIFVVNHWRFSF